MSSKKPTWIVNPKTNRKVMVGSTVYRRLVNQGLIAVDAIDDASIERDTRLEAEREEMYRKIGMEAPPLAKKKPIVVEQKPTEKQIQKYKASKASAVETTSRVAGKIVAQYHHLFTSDMPQEKVAEIIERLTIQAVLAGQGEIEKKSLKVTKYDSKEDDSPSELSEEDEQEGKGEPDGELEEAEELDELDEPEELDEEDDVR